MDIAIERIQSASHPSLKDLLPLYLESFPREERRELNELLKMLNEPEMYFSAVTIESQAVGFVIFWKFAGFLYIEHLAIFLNQRGKGIGGKILRWLQKECSPILLEVEIPFDEGSTKRVAFYNRSGFSPMPVDYCQPPYREGESLLPMMLFSDRSEWDPDVLSRSIELFQHRVYNFRKCLECQK